MITIEKLKLLRESEDNVEFKKGEGGNISYNGNGKNSSQERRRCILGYTVALCNEGGGYLVIGMSDEFPHKVVGTKQNLESIGELESKIYNDLGIRPSIYELYEEEKRVLVIEVPARPAGKVFKFEDVALMRVGEELKPMSDEFYLKIIQEQEPDFSQQICQNITIADLDEKAILILKEKYSQKQSNPQFKTLSTQQLLSDLELSKDGKLTNACLILLGKKEIIKKMLPQSSIRLEYRSYDGKITFDNRIDFQNPFFILIDELWETINLRNGSFPIQEGAYIFNIPYFNEQVIRESINNAIAHRDYRRTSEIIIKQYPFKLEVINAGGFPLGVNIDNLLKTPSTPRNRLLSDILQKTGIVERSGQGVDKIYYNTLAEGKLPPDYSESDNFQVSLKISALIEDRAFALFIQSIQDELTEDDKLSVLDIVYLNKIKNGIPKSEMDVEVINKLLRKNLIEKRGKTNAIFFILSKDYYEFTEEKAKYYKFQELDESQVFNSIFPFLQKVGQAKMGDFVALFENKLSRKQVRLRIEKLVSDKMLRRIDDLHVYTLGEKIINEMEVFSEVINLGIEKFKEKNTSERTKKRPNQK